MERLTGFEPVRTAWKAVTLPLHHSRIGALPGIRILTGLVLSQLSLPIGVEGHYMELGKGLEPPTVCLRSRCATDCANLASKSGANGGT